MSKNKHTKNGTSANSYFKYVFLIVACTIMCMLLYAAFFKAMFSNIYSSLLPYKLSYKYLIIIAIPMVSAFILGASMYAYRKKLRSLESIKNLKIPLMSLGYASSETEAFEIILNFFINQKIADAATLFYKEDLLDEKSKWNKISKNTDMLRNISCNCDFNECLQHFDAGRIKSDKYCRRRNFLFNSGNCMCINILNNEYSCAILQLCSKSKKLFKSENIYIINLFADIARPIISNTQALNALRKKASTDLLTTVYNRDFLNAYLENQLKVADAANHSVSLLIIDVDNFKSINDTYGHLIGDRVLSNAANIMLNCVRKNDVVARYGGDEFIVVLPSTDTDTAYIIAERIVNEIASSKIRPIDGVEIPSITCSIGISTYPDHCKSMEHLISTADSALYEAKRCGKNCVKIYNPSSSAKPDSNSKS
ncbi:MAG TPA: GGDEF domain-containing protein [Clostridiaceae bacterium]|nr:GGDEF domain-containing protein [Clostridiaceae bacterium]